MSKVVYTLYYEVEQYWGIQRDLIGIYTDFYQMLMDVDTHLQNLISQIDVNLCGIAINSSNKQNKRELKVGIKSNDKTYSHVFRWEKVDANTLDFERIELSRFVTSHQGGTYE